MHGDATAVSDNLSMSFSVIYMTLNHNLVEPLPIIGFSYEAYGISVYSSHDAAWSSGSSLGS